jgi:membrane protease YdiL (CAAX protease family)
MFENVENTTYKQVLLLGLLILVGLLVFAAGGMAIASLFWSPEDISAASSYILNTSSQINYMKLLQFLTMFSTFFFPAVALNYLAKSKNFSFLYLNHGIDSQKAIMIIAILIISMPIISGLMEWNSTLHLPTYLSETEEWIRAKEAQLTGITETFMLTTSLGGLLINLFVMAVLPAFGEEFIFRGILIKWFSKSMNIHLAIFISAFLFSAIHIQFLGFFARFFLGMIFGYIFYWSGSLWAPILLHFLNNAMTVVAYYLVGVGSLQDDPATMGTINSTPILMMNILMLIGVLYWFFRNRKVGFQL